LFLLNGEMLNACDIQLIVGNDFESIPLSFIPVIYIQLDGGYVGIIQDGGSIGLT